MSHSILLAYKTEGRISECSFISIQISQFKDESEDSCSQHRTSGHCTWCRPKAQILGISIGLGSCWLCKQCCRCCGSRLCRICNCFGGRRLDLGRKCRLMRCNRCSCSRQDRGCWMGRSPMSRAGNLVYTQYSLSVGQRSG